MYSQILPKDTNLFTQTVDIEWVRAKFVEQNDWFYNVVIEINSQKFLIQFSRDGWLIDSFEVLASKWFIIDLTNSLIFALRNLVQHLCLTLH